MKNGQSGARIVPRRESRNRSAIAMPEWHPSMTSVWIAELLAPSVRNRGGSARSDSERRREETTVSVELRKYDPDLLLVNRIRSKYPSSNAALDGPKPTSIRTTDDWQLITISARVSWASALSCDDYPMLPRAELPMRTCGKFKRRSGCGNSD